MREAIDCTCGGQAMECNTPDENPWYFYECSICDKITFPEPSKSLAITMWNLNNTKES